VVEAPASVRPEPSRGTYPNTVQITQTSTLAPANPSPACRVAAQTWAAHANKQRWHRNGFCEEALGCYVYGARSRLLKEGKSMLFSEAFKIGRTQPELDFVDIDLDADFPLYFDPSTF